MFREGDLVRLRSGGPTMTVSMVCRGDGISYNCSWFDGANRKTENFSEGELVRVSPSESTVGEGASYDPLAAYR
jgi:uncharacterized protein YodC (DUF2158 family)